MKKQIGLILLSIGFIFSCVNAENKQEIGVPVIPSAEKGRHVDSAFMAPDGEHFYTLYEGLLTKFSINPFQKVSSTEIGFKEILSSKNFFKVFITSDEKKLIITNNKKSYIALIDVGTGDFIKTFAIESLDIKQDVPDYPRKRNLPNMMVDAVLNGNDFLVFTTLKVLVFDADTLINKRSVPIDWRAGRRLSSVHKIYDKIVYMSHEGVGIINNKNYGKLEFYRYRSERVSDDCVRIGESSISFDLNSLKKGIVHSFKICGFPEENNNTFSNQRTIKLGFGPISTAGQYVVSGYRYTLQNLKSGKKYTVVQYRDGEAILFDKSDEKQFVLTSKARKRLKMKNSMGEIVPMNDVTFEKYQIINP